MGVLCRFSSLVLVFLYAIAGAAAVETVDLASSTAWTISVDGGAARSIVVPGRGYNAQGISASDNVFYQRSITIPASAAGNVVKIRFGAVNYGADVYLGTALIASHKNLYLPFEADLTGLVTAGSSYTLGVRAYTSGHYGNKIPLGAWVFRGITRYVKLVVLPQVCITDYWIKPSMTNDRLDVDITIRNASAQQKSLTLGASLTSWNNDGWPYPSIAPKTITVAANSTVRATLSAAWGLGPQSYWWPNVPFNENYQARLHYLNLSIKEGATTLDTIMPRFGFVEWSERLYYYTVNGVRITQPSDGNAEGQFSDDAYTESPAWKAPTGPGTGCPESFKRYMRLGVNSNRNHSSIPTEYMMNVADELGFMLIPESAIRGYGGGGVWDSTTHCDDVREMALTCRNHPSVCRYSVHNEYNENSPWEQERLLIDAGWYGDSTRPLVIEGGPNNMMERKEGRHTRGHAYNMLHYGDPRFVRSRRAIIGMGEYSWKMNGQSLPSYCGDGDLMRAADIGLDMRKRDFSYFALWTINNYWPNFLPGINYGNYHCCAQEATGWAFANDRTDNVNGWGSHQVLFLQRCLNPYVVCDSAYDAANTCYSNPWPSTITTLGVGATANRKVYLFNGGLRGTNLKLVWELRWGSATGTLAATGLIDTSIEPGFYKILPVSFTVPAATATASPITVAGGTEMYKETRYYFAVSGSNLYFVLRSFLMPALQRFAVRPGTLELSGQGTVTGDLAVTAAEGTLPALTARSSAGWLSATISGQGNSQTIRATATTATLASGISSASLVLSAPGYEPVTCAVRLQVFGTAVPAQVVILPSHTAALPNGTAAFTARVIDQFGNTVNTPVAWSVAGGGSINGSGLFTSNGTAGSYLVAARVAGDSTKSSLARVAVTQGRPLPSGKITEMLTLNNAQNYASVPVVGPVDKVDGLLVSPDAIPPCHGQRIIADGQTFTWKSRASTNGIWFQTSSLPDFIAYGSITLLNPQPRAIRLSVEHVYGLDVWRDGEKVAAFSGVAVVPNQPVSQATVALPQGASVFIFRLEAYSGPYATIAFSDQSGNPLSDVRYVIDTCGGEMPATALPADMVHPIRDLFAVRIMQGAIELSVQGNKQYRVEFVTPRGQVVKAMHGAGSQTYQIPTRSIGRGVYLVKSSVGPKRSVHRIVVW